jgi:hypothetical protein
MSEFSGSNLKISIILSIKVLEEPQGTLTEKSALQKKLSNTDAPSQQ